MRNLLTIISILTLALSPAIAAQTPVYEGPSNATNAERVARRADLNLNELYPRRLPYNPITVVMGDSYSQQHTKTVTTGNEVDYRFVTQGIVGWMRAKSQGALSGSLSYANVIGTGNTSTSWHIANQLPQVLAAKPNLVVWFGGTNDNNAGNFDGIVVPAATTLANYAYVAQQLLNTGASLMLFTIPPRGPYSVAQEQNIEFVNQGIRALPATYNNVMVVDAAQLLVDHTSATGAPLASLFTTDLVHLNPSGAYIVGTAAANMISSRILPRNPIENNGVSNTYNATINPFGNLLGSISEVQGTGGTFGSDTTVTGTIASGWIVRNYSNGVGVAVSKGSRLAVSGGSPITTQRLVFTPSGTGLKSVYASSSVITVASGAVAPGDNIRIAAYERANVVTGMFNGSLCVAEVLSGGLGQVGCDLFSQSDAAGIDGGYYYLPTASATDEYRLEPPSITLSANAIGVQMYWQFLGDGATMAGDFEMGEPLMRKNLPAGY